MHYDNKAYYLISEAGKDQLYKMGEKEDSKKKEVYTTSAKEFAEEGKSVRIMMFRNLKEERIRDSRVEGDYANWPRENLEKKLEFGTFLVFNQALSRKTVNIVTDLKAA